MNAELYVEMRCEGDDLRLGDLSNQRFPPLPHLAWPIYAAASCT